MTDNSGNKLWVYRRRMPHWRLEGSVYFVTWRLQKSQKMLAEIECEIMVSTLKHFDGQRFELLAYVVMPDHVHVLVRPYEGYLLHELVHSWKSYTANRLQRVGGRKGRIWQEDYFDRIMRDEPEFIEKAQYILNNPLKIKPQIEEYPWVWVKPAI
jgi:REP element-mobilizing transposase RayT